MNTPPVASATKSLGPITRPRHLLVVDPLVLPAARDEHERVLVVAGDQQDTAPAERAAPQPGRSHSCASEPSKFQSQDGMAAIVHEKKRTVRSRADPRGTSRLSVPTTSSRMPPAVCSCRPPGPWETAPTRR